MNRQPGGFPQRTRERLAVWSVTPFLVPTESRTQTSSAGFSSSLGIEIDLSMIESRKSKINSTQIAVVSTRFCSIAS
jgi:hypothetical protein